jgi:tetratricopeptide (TPR) repeat protein
MNPTHTEARITLLQAYINEGQKDKAQVLSDQLLMESPDNPAILIYAALVDMQFERWNKAESRIENLIEMMPYNDEVYLLMAKVKLGLRNYDNAIYFTNQALELNPENVEALNLKIMLLGINHSDDTDESLETALHLDPENASTIANHAMQLMRKGNTKESLERFKEALSIDQTNQLARYGMSEALKSQFPPYRWYFLLKEKLSALSAKGSWAYLLGFFVMYRILIAVSKSNPEIAPFLQPIILIFFIFFLSSWIFEPIMNVYLLGNKYGRLLLDKDDKVMAKLCASSLICSFIFFILFAISLEPKLLFASIVFFAFLLPLGSFLTVVSERNRKITTAMTVGIIAVSLLSFLVKNSIFFISAILLFVAYQWIVNGMRISENARVYD